MRHAHKRWAVRRLFARAAAPRGWRERDRGAPRIRAGALLEMGRQRAAALHLRAAEASIVQRRTRGGWGGLVPGINAHVWNARRLARSSQPRLRGVTSEAFSRWWRTSLASKRRQIADGEVRAAVAERQGRGVGSVAGARGGSGSAVAAAGCGGDRGPPSSARRLVDRWGDAAANAFVPRVAVSYHRRAASGLLLATPATATSTAPRTPARTPAMLRGAAAARHRPRCCRRAAAGGACASRCLCLGRATELANVVARAVSSSVRRTAEVDATARRCVQPAARARRYRRPRACGGRNAACACGASDGAPRGARAAWCHRTRVRGAHSLARAVATLLAGGGVAAGGLDVLGGCSAAARPRGRSRRLPRRLRLAVAVHGGGPSFTLRAAASAPPSSACRRLRRRRSGASRVPRRRGPPATVAGRGGCGSGGCAAADRCARRARGAWRRWLAARGRSEVLVLMDSVALHFRLVTWQRHAVASRTLAGSRLHARPPSPRPPRSAPRDSRSSWRRRARGGDEERRAARRLRRAARVQLRRLRNGGASARGGGIGAGGACLHSCGGSRHPRWPTRARRVARARVSRRCASSSAEGALAAATVALQHLALADERTRRCPPPPPQAWAAADAARARAPSTGQPGDMLARRHAGYAQGVASSSGLPAGDTIACRSSATVRSAAGSLGGRAAARRSSPSSPAAPRSATSPARTRAASFGAWRSRGGRHERRRRRRRWRRAGSAAPKARLPAALVRHGQARRAAAAVAHHAFTARCAALSCWHLLAMPRAFLPAAPPPVLSAAAERRRRHVAARTDRRRRHRRQRSSTASAPARRGRRGGARPSLPMRRPLIGRGGRIAHRWRAPCPAAAGDAGAAAFAPGCDEPGEHGSAACLILPVAGARARAWAPSPALAVRRRRSSRSPRICASCSGFSDAAERRRVRTSRWRCPAPSSPLGADQVGQDIERRARSRWRHLLAGSKVSYRALSPALRRRRAPAPRRL